MAVVLLEAFRYLREAITCVIPELEGKVCVGQSPPDRTRPWPNLTIDPGRLRYEPDQALEVHEPRADSVVVNVGRFEGPIVLRLGAATLGERYELEARLLDLFLSQDSPGVLVTQVLSCPDLGEFTAAWCLEDEEWQDDRAFDREFYSIVTCVGSVPALATRRGVYTIQDLRVGLADLGVTATPATFMTDARIDVVRVNDDGTLTPL